MRHSLSYTLAMATIAAAALAACGGGGGSAGTTSSSGSGSSGTSGSTTTPTYESVTINVLDASDNPTVYVSASSTSRVRVSVTDKSGAPAVNRLVAISADNSLVSFLPSVARVITDSSGVAEFDLKPSDSTAAGAVVLTAEATLADGTTVSSSKPIQVSSSAVTSPTVDPQTLVRSIALSSVSPTDKSIVIKGAGATGRSETAAVSFKLLDADGAPVKGARVSFAINSPSNPHVATLNIASATSDIDGVVTTTLNSGTVPGSVVVTARVQGTTISSQSDQITVTTDVVSQAGFELVAAKYNLDGTLTGDSTNLTAYLRDANGNPVADGVAVVFTTDFGRVGSASRGACVTENGTCSVQFMVQDPRGQGLATVVASANTGTGATAVSDSLSINMAAAASQPVIAPTAVSIDSTCKARHSIVLNDGSGRALAAGTTLAVTSLDNPGLSVSVVDGSPVIDSRGGSFAPTAALLEFSSPSAECDANTPALNVNTGTATVRVRMTTPGNTVFDRAIDVTYARK